MHLRKLLILLGVLSLLLSRSVLALGLGDISLNSSLNQPLDAHIGLRDLGDLSAEQVVVKLGTQEDFEKVGLERSFFYTQLRFKVVDNGPNGPFIAVTSRDPVREPYLSFVVDMRWNSGRVMREYTLLLDLPNFSGEAAAPIQGSVTPLKSTTRPAASEPAAAPRDTSGVSRDSAGGDVYGPVKASDTLWEIARDYRPGNASIHQTMLAIQEANPDAFIRNNINLMRKGQVLRIPSESEIRGLNNRQAINRVAEQNREWSGNTLGAQLDGSGRSSAKAAAATEVSGRLRLASGSDSSDTTVSDAGAGAASEQLSQELTSAKDELARSRGENSELRSRVTDLEEQIETMERLLAVSSEQMRALELAAQQDDAADGDVAQDDAEQGETAQDDVAEPSAIDSEQRSQDAAIAEQTAATAPETTEPEQAKTPEPEATPAVRNTTKVIRRAPEPTLMDKVMDNLLWLVLAVVLLLILAVLALRKRGTQDDDSDDFTPDYDDSLAYEDAQTEAEMEAAEQELAPEQEFDEEPLFDETELEAPESVEAETGDVVGEADIYIALGKYEQAEEMLLRGLEREPGSMPINLKLLELYGESNDLEAFDKRFTAVASQGDEASTARGYSLRAQHFPGALEFVAPVAAASATPKTEDAAIEDDFAQAFDELEDAPSEADANEVDLSDDFDFDFSDDLEQSLEDDNKDFQLDDFAADSADKNDTDLGTSSGSRYDLSFDLEDEAEDDTAFELDLEDDASEASAPEQDALALDELELTLDEDATASTADASDLGDLGDLGDLADLEFELDSAEETPSAAPLLDEAAQLDGDLDFDQVPELDAAADSEAQVPTLDAADDDSDDFDLDKAMEDFDLAALDEEMASLDVAGEPADSFDSDEAFEQALGADEQPVSSDQPHQDLADDEFDFLADSDEVTTKLDLARAYIDMGDLDGARDILSEVAEEGDEAQKAEALSLLDKAKS